MCVEIRLYRLLYSRGEAARNLRCKKIIKFKALKAKVSFLIKVINKFNKRSNYYCISFIDANKVVSIYKEEKC